MMDMKKLVEEKIQEIEAKEHVEVLFAVESGSRAWGFDSPDSDYDVRFIYQRKEEDYLKLEGIRDVIEWQLDDTLDISGWDLQKALRLLYRSNPTLFEWFNSKIIYYKTDKMDVVKEVLPQYFSQKKSLYHYWHMATNNNKEFIQNGNHMIKIKKYFYVLRAILSCQWILEKNTNPPMEFEDLIEAQMVESLKPTIKDLLNKKMNVPELKMVPKNAEIDQYINGNLELIEQTIKQLPDHYNNDWQPLNELFIDLIK